MARFMIPAERFPLSPALIRTRLGIVEFVDQAADVDDAELAQALREVPAVFGIVEHDAEAVRDPGSADEVARPSVRASKAEWVAYVAHIRDDITAEEADSMTKAELIETFGG